MNHLPIDPDADSSRRAWLPCPNCRHGHDCPDCRDTLNCKSHWQYLLGNEGTRVSMQCPTCAHMWTIDTAQQRAQRRGVVAMIPLDGLPCDIVGHPNGEFIYATTAKAVRVVDRAYRVIASIPVDAEPKRTMVSADGTRIYVVGYDGTLSIIDAADHSVRTAVGEASSAEIVSPTDNHIYRAHNQGRNCWVSAVSDDGTSATVIPVDSYASALALTPDGGQLFVALSKPKSTRRCGHGSIAIIHTATLTPIDVIAMALAPDTLAVSPDGHSLYATHYNNNAVSVIELGSRSQTLISLTDAPLDLVVSHDGAQLYVTNLHSLSVIDTRTNLVEDLPIGDLPRHFGFSNDGKFAFVTDMCRRSVWVLDPVEKTIVGVLDLDMDPKALTLMADERLLYVADGLTSALNVVSIDA